MSFEVQHIPYLLFRGQESVRQLKRNTTCVTSDLLQKDLHFVCKGEEGITDLKQKCVSVLSMVGSYEVKQ